MKVTTARDPSVRARRLAKALARFLSVPYITRGKQSLDANDKWLVVVESYGNPSGLIKRNGELEQKLTFSISMEPRGGQSLQKKRNKPVVTGVGDSVRSIAEFLELGMSADLYGRIIVVSSGEMAFLDAGQTIIKLKI
jgi:hypothetical protein